MPTFPIFYIPVHGTWAIDENEEAWWKPTGHFARFAASNNVFQYDRMPPFIWSSDIDGIGYNLLRPKTKLTDWLAGGWSLRYYCENIPAYHRNIIAHSHGLQPVLFYASLGNNVNNLISVCSPIRDDMKEITERARPFIKNWLHIYDTRDFTQFLGQIGDGRWFGSRASAYADVNHKLVGIDHSTVLRVDANMHYWNSQGWFDYLRQ